MRRDIGNEVESNLQAVNAIYECLRWTHLTVLEHRLRAVLEEVVGTTASYNIGGTAQKRP
ncbi:hypothetical protein PL11_002255 [Lentilactobacillus curieae]|uniref:Uncharacterized protein n=1 Tax=Lentilactobacillus curieae TaxID=1138822 RepID=A0A1S6QGU1_9LACO|nr:hypothetical protein PL11_002255 [Lentilactobacillus curieae]